MSHALCDMKNSICCVQEWWGKKGYEECNARERERERDAGWSEWVCEREEVNHTSALARREREIVRRLVVNKVFACSLSLHQLLPKNSLCEFVCASECVYSVDERVTLQSKGKSLPLAIGPWKCTSPHPNWAHALHSTWLVHSNEGGKSEGLFSCWCALVSSSLTSTLSLAWFNLCVCLWVCVSECVCQVDWARGALFLLSFCNPFHSSSHTSRLSGGCTSRKKEQHRLAHW